MELNTLVNRYLNLLEWISLNKELLFSPCVAVNENGLDNVNIFDVTHSRFNLYGIHHYQIHNPEKDFFRSPYNPFQSNNY